MLWCSVDWTGCAQNYGDYHSPCKDALLLFKNASSCGRTTVLLAGLDDVREGIRYFEVFTGVATTISLAPQ